MKILKETKNKIKFYVISWIFRTYFGSFMYPFDRADDAYKKLPAHEKASYLQAVHNWVNSNAYRLESQEIIRKFYQELALKPCDEISVSAYRLAIMIERDKQVRLQKKSKEFQEIEVIR